jgi:hypothetical protein
MARRNVDREWPRVAHLFARDTVQVVSDRDYPNPHIRPWASRRSVEDQIRSLEAITAGGYGVCLYPTPLGMRRVRLPRRFTGRPYEQALARGQGVLELAFFEFAVLEPYRNDPRYNFDFDDFGADMGVSDDVYFDASEPERDKVSLQHIGFAYDLSKYDKTDPTSPIIRRVTAFVGDLARLTHEHQQRWKTYEVASDGLEAHPVWWGIQMGEWPDGCGPFHRMLFEMENLNALWENVFGTALFRTTDRPREFGWLLRPSRNEWDRFVHQLDKLLSENLDSKALDAAGAPKTDSQGQQIGSLNRLKEVLLKYKVTAEAARTAMQPLRDVRAGRQRPAHALGENITDSTFVHQQVALLERINDSLTSIRNWLATHPKNRTLALPHDDEWIEREYRM